MEYVSPEGLRLDGRRPMEVSLSLYLSTSVFQDLTICYHNIIDFQCLLNSSLFSFVYLCIFGPQMRQIRAEIGAVAKADGSAVFEMGNTKVIAAVYGPREVQNRSQQSNDKALVRCEYSMANFSTGDRMRKPKGDRRSTEISLVIRQTMEACILTHLMPRSQIDIFVQVLQADGGKLKINQGHKTLWYFDDDQLLFTYMYTLMLPTVFALSLSDPFVNENLLNTSEITAIRYAVSAV
ncbi:hypothetical protein F0562_019315 [Nyssa sinensis]|uniref:Exoribonuclease phosphorolytic domain-containing protein n=1 Tax=Nyssa sinensis TaxID=561372 RepID=A0A5J4ZEH2_9ASTE|nr:hypothetical protein F0562_019315 [Nyssa sinensis]